MPPGGIRFSVTVSDRAVLDALREARRDIGKDVKGVLLDIAQDVVLPVARRRVPGRWGSHITARATTRNAYLTTNLRGQLRAAYGLLEFGGSARGAIRPRHRTASGHPPALRVGGVVRAIVTTPRRYRARHWLTDAVHSQRPRIEREIADRVTAALEERIERAGGSLG